MKTKLKSILAVALCAVRLSVLAEVAPEGTLCITALEKCSISMYPTGSGWTYPTVQYLTEGDAEWREFTIGSKDKVVLEAGRRVWFRGNNPDGFSKDTSNYVHFSLSVGSGKIAASGSVMSLIDPDLKATAIPCDACFCSLFNGCTSLTTAPALPATTLSDSCYEDMFYGCTSLTNAPALPAETLADRCYYRMFYRCTSLTNAPALPAETLADSCYYGMFYYCTSLTNAPALPATTLAGSCYYGMFGECKSLTTAPAELPATTLATNCYYEMFQNCTSLTTAPAELPATTLAESCYEYMFDGCTSLTNVPALPATTLTNNCYSYMFRECKSLTTAPALPAETLAAECYRAMFNNCTNLTTAPAELPAPTLADTCYYGMFYGCTSLTNAPALPAERLTAKCYYCMFQGCTSLTNAPALPAETLAAECYVSMFQGCTSLTDAPVLPATTLTVRCYSSMFYRCTSLTNAPALPATTLADRCYESMFNGCTSLTNAPALPAETLADKCYNWMFSGCTSLTEAPALPATTLTESCYESMFQNCTSLTNAPALPATTLAGSCYYSMFQNCTSLTNAPALPATTLTDSCYYSMFKGCTKLTNAPALPATTLADRCYNSMFKGCTKLDRVIVGFSAWSPTTKATQDWLKDVAAEGTFACPASLDVSTRGANYVPAGWTVEPVVVAQFVKGGEVVVEFATAEAAVAALDDAQYADIEEFRIGLTADTVFDFGGRTNRVVIGNVGAVTNTLKNVFLDGTDFAVTGSVGRVVFGDGVRIEKADLDFMKGGFGFDLIIKGGLYKNEPRGYCEDGYLSALRYDENEHLNGLYAVLPAAEIAVEDPKDLAGTRYATLQDAFNLIGENKEVKLRLFNNLKLGTAVAKLEGNKVIHLLPGEPGTNTIKRVGAEPVIEIGLGAKLEISNVIFDGANVTSEKPMIEVAGKTGTKFGWLIAGDGFVVSNAVGGAVHVGNGGKFELNGVAKIIENTTGGKPKNVIIEDKQAIVLMNGGAVTDGNYAQIGVYSDNDKFMIPGGQFGAVDKSYEYATYFSDGDISVAKPWVGFINDRDGTLHHAAGAKIAAAPAEPKKTYKRWVGGEYKELVEEGDYLISRVSSFPFSPTYLPELIWTARQDAPAAQPAPAVLDWTDTTLTLAVSNGCDYALVTSGSAETNWVSMVATDNTYAFARPAGTDYLCLRRYSITPSNVVSAATAYSVRVAAGTKDDPWFVGAENPEDVTAWTNGNEFVVSGDGTVSDLSKLASKVTVEKLTIKDATVTVAASDAFQGFGASGSEVSLTLPDGWQGELPDDEGNWYGAEGVTLTAVPLAVKNVTFQQRYPWNGLVDINFNLTGEGMVNVAALVTTNGVALANPTVTGETVFDLGGGKELKNLKLVWDAKADLPANFTCDDVVIEVTAGRQKTDGDYMVIDLSADGNGRFAVSYEDMDVASAIEKYNTDEYKTGKLVLKKIPAGTAYPCEPRMIDDVTSAPIGGTMTPAKDYFIGLFETTAAQYDRVMGVETPSDATTPKNNISYNMIRSGDDSSDIEPTDPVTAESFMGILVAKTGVAGFDLPTEIQWEIAVRAGSTAEYGSYLDEGGNAVVGTYDSSAAPWGNTTNFMWFAKNNVSQPGVKSVGLLRPNLWGLYDTAGNVYEFCLDVYNEDKTSWDDVETPEADGDSYKRALRGGYFAKAATISRPSVRASGYSDDDGISIGAGFRLCRTVATAGSSTSATATSISEAFAVDLREDVALSEGEVTVSNVTWSATLWGELDEEFVTAIGWTNLTTGATGVFSNLARVVGEAAEDADLPQKDGDYKLTHSTGGLTSIVKFTVTGYPLGCETNPWKVGPEEDPERTVAWRDGNGNVYFKPPRSAVSRTGLETVTNAMGGASFTAKLIAADSSATNDLVMLLGASGTAYDTIADALAANEASYTLFEVPSYTVSYSGGEGASGAMADDLFIPIVPTNLTANAFEIIGYDFTGWSKDGTTVAYTNRQEGVDFAQPGETLALTALWTHVGVEPANYTDLADKLARMTRPVTFDLVRDIEIPAGGKIEVPAGKSVTFVGEGKLDVTTERPALFCGYPVGTGLKPEDLDRFITDKDVKAYFEDGKVVLVARGESEDFPWALDEESGVTAWVDAALTNFAAVVVDDGMAAATNAIDIVALTNNIATYGYEPTVTPLNAFLKVDDGGKTVYMMPAGWIGEDGIYATLEDALVAGETAVVPDFDTEEVPAVIAETGKGADGETYAAVVENRTNGNENPIKAAGAEGLLALATNGNQNVTLVAETVDEACIPSEDAAAFAAANTNGVADIIGYAADYVDLSLKIGEEPQEEIGEPLAIAVPWAVNPRQVYSVSRIVEGVAEPLPVGEENAVDGEYVEVLADGFVIHAKKFALYAIGEITLQPRYAIVVGNGGKVMGEADPTSIATNFAVNVQGLDIESGDIKGYCVRAKGEDVGEYAINFVCTKCPQGYDGELVVVPGVFTITAAEMPAAGGKVSRPKAAKGSEYLKPATKATWKASAKRNCVFTGWAAAEGATKAATNRLAKLSWNELRDPKLSFTVGKSEKIRPADFAATWANIEEDAILGMELTATNLTVDTLSHVTAKASGLPSGVKFSAKTLKLSGKPKKNGTFKVTVSVKNASGYSAKQKFSVVVSGKKVKSVIPADDFAAKGVPVTIWCDSAMGSVTGAGVYALPKTLKIEAKPKKGYEFAGWYWDPGYAQPVTTFVGGKDSRGKVQKLVLEGGTRLYARFVEKTTKADPIVWLRYAGAGYCGADAGYLAETETWYKGVKLPKNACQVSFGSLTWPTVKATGLPKGVTFDAKTLRFKGVPTKAGTYTVKVSVKNRAGSTDVLTRKVKVVSLPKWAVGTFDGYHVEDGATNGTFKATAGSTGEVSGKTKGGLASTTFSAKSFADVELVDGALCYVAKVSVSYRDPATKKTVKRTDTLYLMENPETGLGTIGGWDDDGNGCIGVQRAWERTDLDMPAFDTKALKSPLKLGNGITLKFGATGKVTVAGKVPGDDGSPVTVSGSAYVLPLAWRSTMTPNLLAQTCVYVPATENLADGFCEVCDLLLGVGEGGKFDQASVVPPPNSIHTPFIIPHPVLTDDPNPVLTDE